jgi:hypothetical protein
MLKTIILSLAGATLFVSSPVLAKSFRIHGYVTAVNSSNEFEIDDYLISKDASLTLELEKSEDPGEHTTFSPAEVRVGTEMEIKGELDEASNRLTAKVIKVYLEEHLHVKRTALMESVPDIRKVGTRWEGKIRVDGQRLTIDETTVITIKSNNLQKKAAKQSAKAGRKSIAQPDDGSSTDDGADKKEESGATLIRLDQIKGNTFVSYDGIRQKDGSIVATKVEFVENELTSGEARLWKVLTPKIKEPDFAALKPGALTIQQVGKFKLVPNAAVQSYVQQLGTSLIPKYQRDLQAGDPQKIPFRFLVVDNKEPNAFALANGTVVVNSGIMTVLENEAQFAAVISHEMSHATEEHTYRQSQYHKKALIALKIGAAVGAAYGGKGVTDLANLTEAAIRNGYSRSLENQADRVGMEYMVTAGYDPREAARVWKVLSLKVGDHPTNVFWSSHDNNTTRRSYLMAELKNNYGGMNFDALRRDGEGFSSAVGTLKNLYAPKARKIKVKY